MLTKHTDKERNTKDFQATYNQSNLRQQLLWQNQDEKQERIRTGMLGSSLGSAPSVWVVLTGRLLALARKEKTKKKKSKR